MSSTVISRDEAIRLREGYRLAGKKVGFTSGVFDIVHPGHIDYLRRAAALVDVLVVGVNADSSVKKNKGESRPINGERQRAEVVGGVKGVTHVFIFEELNNNVNVEALKPDLYIKAGDYSSEKLSSKALVESYGGRVEIVSFKDGFSTTGIIEKIAAASVTEEGPAVPHPLAPVVFLDRDGTLNEHLEYLSEPKNFREIPNSFLALKRLRDLGYRIIIVTNQPGIGLGYFEKEEFFAVNREMFRQAAAVGAAFDKVYFCPHSKAEECECRKPKPYFLKRAERELNLDLSKSFMIGDMTSDIQLAKAGGCRSILVETGRGGKDGMFQATADYVAKDLAAAAQWIEAQGPVVRGEPSNPPTSAGGTQEGMDKLVTSVSADFNNIFGSILGCVALIGQRSGGEGSVPGVDETLTILKRAADRGLAISKKMGGLLWSGETSKSKRSLKACIGSVVELLRSSHGDECQIELLCPQDVEVEMADFVVVQMLLELCENSLQAMATLPERFILFHVDVVEVGDSKRVLDVTPGSYAKVSIVDHGEGISSERREVVFEPAETERTHGSAGMGVSLSMAKSVMRKHGGTITLASQLNAGTNISLYFPLAQK